MTHACLRRKMDHAFDSEATKAIGERLEIGNVDAFEMEALAAIELFQAIEFEGLIVVVVEVINPDNRFATVEQTLTHVHAYETGCTGNRSRHPSVPVPRSGSRTCSSIRCRMRTDPLRDSMTQFQPLSLLPDCIALAGCHSGSPPARNSALGLDSREEITTPAQDVSVVFDALRPFLLRARLRFQ